MKRLLATLLTVFLLVGVLPQAALAKAKAMRDGVPVWTEETVKQYALDFIHGNDMERLFGYYDLQIRRYMPMDTYTGMLTEIEWLTGDFVAFGTYSSFEEPEQKTKTHVLHLCMEKQDLDLYFTHKNEEDDWEVMAVEFVPGEKQEADAAAAASVQEDTAYTTQYTEEAVTVGEEPYLLSGILTLPYGASADAPVPAVVLVHDSGPHDMDESVGQTKLFADIAQVFAAKGVATLRYDKRTYTYGDAMTAEETAAMTVEEEVVRDAISAGQLLAADARVDASHVVVLGHGLGAMLAPRIVSESKGVFSAMIFIAGSPLNLLDLMAARKEAALASLEGDGLTAAQAALDDFKAQAKTLKRITKAAKAKEITVEGVNGYYYWEMMQTDAVSLIKKLKVPTYIVQGNRDFEVTLDDGIDAYEDDIESKYSSVTYKLFRNLNHLLMLYDGPAESKGTAAEYDTPATLDKQAGRYMADWVLDLGKTDDEE